MTQKRKTLIKDIALEAGVSPALVSFVLSGKGREHRVSEKTVAQVVAIADKMNYLPNASAQSLRSGKTKTLGVVLSDISNPFFANIARGIEDVAAHRGYTVFFCSSDESSDKMGALVSSLIARNVDGLVIVPCDGSENIIRRLSENNVPIVLFDRPYRDMEISSVSLNNFSASYHAVEHLIKSGAQKVGMVAYDQNLVHMHDRIRGYRSAMEDAGMKSLITLGYTKMDDLQRSADKVLAKMLDKEVDALFFATNSISLACLHYIKDKGIEVPGQLKLVGFDGSDAFDLFSSSITYVRQPISSLSQKVVEVVVEMIENKNSLVNNIQIDGELIIRESS